MEITHENAILYARIIGLPRLRLSAEAENVFFFAAAAGQIYFRVEAGKTVALILHEQGAEQVMPRVSAEVSRTGRASRSSTACRSKCARVGWFPFPRIFWNAIGAITVSMTGM